MDFKKLAELCLTITGGLEHYSQARRADKPVPNLNETIEALGVAEINDDFGSPSDRPIWFHRAMAKMIAESAERNAKNGVELTPFSYVLHPEMDGVPPRHPIYMLYLDIPMWKPEVMLHLKIHCSSTNHYYPVEIRVSDTDTSQMWRFNLDQHHSSLMHWPARTMHPYVDDALVFLANYWMQWPTHSYESLVRLTKLAERIAP